MTNANAANTGLSNLTLEGRDEYNAWYGEQIAAGKTPADIAQLIPTAGLIVDGVKEIKDSNGNVTGYENNTTPVNPQTYWRSLYGDNATAEPFIYDATNIRLRELVFGYSMPKRLLGNSGFTSIDFSLVGRNLFFFLNKAEHFDPEAGAGTGNLQGIESFNIPSTRDYGVNVKFGF